VGRSFLLRRGRGLHSHHLDHAASLAFAAFFPQEEIYDRFHLARGPAYAVSTLVHYVVLLVGFYIAIAALGADMTKFAILAGAFGVGIGFGLQNVVNNFLSGLILFSSGRCRWAM
jgi:Small-conductance mechanosensitive channel